MVRPVMRYLHSPDLSEPALPPDPENCVVFIQAMVGPEDGPGQESFGFEVVTPAYLREQGRPRWGRGLLILDSFDWIIVRKLVNERLSMAARETWSEVGQELSKEFHWEFDNYKPDISRETG